MHACIYHMPSAKAKLVPQQVSTCGHLWKKLMPSARALRSAVPSLTPLRDSSKDWLLGSHKQRKIPP